MDAPPPKPRRFTRRTLLRLAAGGIVLGLSAEAVRVFALTNQHTVIPGQVYRSAQLDREELGRVIAEKNIRTVINLRGTCPETGWYVGECEATAAAGISQEDITLSAKRLPAPAEVRRVVEVLDRTERPVIIHCQRGADRTGLVSTIAVLLQDGSTLDQARRQLWPRYGHIEVGRTAVVDEFFDLYAAWLAEKKKSHTPEVFRGWAESEYCPGPYRAALSLVGPNPATVPAGRGFTLTVRAVNTSVAAWTFRPGGSGGIQLRYQLFTPQGEILYKGRAGHLAATVPPRGTIDLAAGFPPLTTPGRYLVHADLLDAGAIDLLAADFVQYGSEPLVFDVNVR